MFLIYLLIGVGLAFLIHLVLSRLQRVPPERLKRFVKAGGVVAAAVLVMRLGLSRLFAFYSMLPLLVRLFGGRAAQAGAPPPLSSMGAMSRAQAAELLGVSQQATPEEIHATHRRLMQKLHPDAGGSEGLAKQLNEARDVLLGK